MKKIVSKIVLGLALAFLSFGCVNGPTNPMFVDMEAATASKSHSSPNAYNVWLGASGGLVGAAKWSLGAYTMQTATGIQPDQGVFQVTTVCPAASPEGNLSLLTLNMESTGYSEIGDIGLMSGSNYSSFNLGPFTATGHVQFDAYNETGLSGRTITIQWGNNTTAANANGHWIGGGAQGQLSYTSITLPTLGNWNHYSIALAMPSEEVSASVLTAVNEVVVTLGGGTAGNFNGGDVFIDNLQFTEN
jgi:hypothetical protein